MSAQPAEPATHTLLRIGGVAALASDAPVPPWVADSLQRASWVVVRRATSCGSLIPVGVRGEAREQRFAAWIAAQEILDRLTPQALAASRCWGGSVRRVTVPALAALDAVESIMRARGLEGAWGPTGSVGFELASNCPTARVASDLDLAIRLDHLLSLAAARSLEDALSALPVRCDVLLEMPHGAVSLAELTRRPERILLRTPLGPRLIGSTCGAAAD